MYLGLPSSFRPRAHGFALVARQRASSEQLYQWARRAAIIIRASAIALALVLLVGNSDKAEADTVLSLVIKDHRFVPSELTVSAGERFRIEVENLDPTPAEFESSALKVEKIVVGGSKIILRVGPLRPGTYSFFDDYHPDEAKGTLTAIEPKPSQ